MYDGRSVLAVVPARGGSKGLPGKNLAELDGKPLVAWSVLCGRASEHVDNVVCSTDDQAIAGAAAEAGAEIPCLRPPELASDTASAAEVVAHMAFTCPGYDLMVLLQPTSPLRSPSDIDAAIAALVASEADSCRSVVAVEEHPWLMYRVVDGRLCPAMADVRHDVRRQEFPEFYRLNGAIYVVTRESLERTRSLVGDIDIGYVMAGERSVDIDTAEDLERARRLARDGHGPAQWYAKVDT